MKFARDHVTGHNLSHAGLSSTCCCFFGGFDLRYVWTQTVSLHMNGFISNISNLKTGLTMAPFILCLNNM